MSVTEDSFSWAPLSLFHFSSLSLLLDPVLFQSICLSVFLQCEHMQSTLMDTKLVLKCLCLLVPYTHSSWYSFTLYSLKKKNKTKKTFIYLAVPGLRCGSGIFSCGMQSLDAACGILVPWPGIEPRPPALGAQSLSHQTTREVPALYSWGPQDRCCFFLKFSSLKRNQKTLN